jgi:hypothetical protein
MLLTLVEGFVVNTPIRNYKKYIDNNVVKVFEPYNIEKNQTSCILFYTGANSLVPGEIYTDFINKLAGKNFSVHVSPNNQELSEDLVYQLCDEYKEVVPVTHSSGCINAIKNCNKNRGIKKAIFMDPVDNRELLKTFGGYFNPLSFMNKKEEKAEKLKYMDNILFLNAKKSYEWKLYPFTVPFIPGFALKEEEIANKDTNIVKIEASDFGHSDILDNLWSDLMHGTISKGYETRDEEKLSEYRSWLASMIYDFVLNENIDDKNILEDINYKYLN